MDQVPNISRVVLHGVGEPMMVRELPRMIRYLKDRGAYVLFNTNGTVLTARKGRELVDTGLDELRVSLDAADATTFLEVRGKDYFNRIVRNLRAFTEMQAREGLAPEGLVVADRFEGNHRPAPRFRADRPRHRRQGGLSAAARVLRSRCYWDGAPDQALFERLSAEETSICLLRKRRRKSRHHFQCSGATEPGNSLARKVEKSVVLCRRPWTVMYFTANGRALPCCIAPFAQKG